jgi:hypothetical protein
MKSYQHFSKRNKNKGQTTTTLLNAIQDLWKGLHPRAKRNEEKNHEYVWDMVGALRTVIDVGYSRLKISMDHVNYQFVYFLTSKNQL